jgi:cell division protein FtsQ
VLLLFVSTGFWYVVPRVWDFLKKQEKFRLEQIEFANCEHLDQNELRALLPELKGTNLFVIELKQLEKALQQHLWIEGVCIERQLPHKLVISIIEREPVALINTKPLLAVDKSGLLLPLKNWQGVLDLPLIRHSRKGRLTQGSTLDSETETQALHHLERMRRQIPEVWQLISEMAWNSKGELVFYSSGSRTKIVLGIDPNWRQFLNFYSFFIYEGGQSGIKNIELVDLRFNGQVIVRRKNESS